MRLRDRIWLLGSQALNALAFGGDPDESMSARAWRESRASWIARIDGWLGAGHCAAVYAQQQNRQSARIEQRTLPRPGQWAHLHQQQHKQE